MIVASLLPESLGDFLLALPSLKSLEESFPEEKCVWYVPDSAMEVASLLPLGAERVPLSAIGKRDVPDLTFCFPPATRYYRLARRLGGKQRAGYVHEKMWIPRLVSRMALTHRWICPDGAEIHELEAYGKVLEIAGVHFDSDRLSIEVPRQAARSTEIWLRERGVEPGARVAAVHLNSRWCANPLLPLRRLRGCRVLALFNAPEERAARAFLREAELRDVLVPGPRPFAEYAAFVEASGILIAVDGGPVHVAAAVKTPVAVFYPEERFTFRVSKWHPWKIRFEALPLNAISLEKLPEAAETLLAAS